MTNKEYLFLSDENLYEFMVQVCDEDPSLYSRKYCRRCEEQLGCSIDIEDKCRYTDKEFFIMWMNDIREGKIIEL